MKKNLQIFGYCSISLRKGMRGPIHNKKASPDRQGFTLVELLVVVAIVVILMVLQLPAYTTDKTKSKGLQCLNNLRQLGLAWHMYAEDNHDYFLYSSDDGEHPGSDGDNYAWTWSKMDFNSGLGNRYNWDPAADIELRPLWQYNKNYHIYKCPGDPSVVSLNGRAVPRIRSYSMNIFLGGEGGSVPDYGPWSGYFPAYKKLTELADPVHSPGAANTFLFIEERADCINWGNFFTDMQGYPLPNMGPMPSTYEWNVDLPGAYHERAGGISFCDGHAEMHKWLNGSTTPPVLPIPGPQYAVVPAPYSADVAWLQNAAARPH
jgi:prepilin-type N-terminal cleavage/methylation domain-containing protein/prepilin-type processing-associated H-X9-DG protein